MLAEMIDPQHSDGTVTPEEWAALEALERDAQIFARLRGDRGDVLLFLLQEATLRFVMVSRTVEDVLGWTQAEIADRPFFELIHPDDQERTRQAHSRFSAGQRTVALGFRNRYRSRDGRWVWLEWGNSWRSAAHDYTLVTARAIRGAP